MAADTPIPPTLEDTQRALEAISSPERAVAAAVALRALGEAIIRAVTAVDRAHNVGAYLLRVELLAHGEGNFEIKLYDQNTGADPDAIARDIAAVIADDGAAYGKPLRPVQLGFHA